MWAGPYFKVKNVLQGQIKVQMFGAKPMEGAHLFAGCQQPVLLGFGGECHEILQGRVHSQHKVLISITMKAFHKLFIK